MKVNKAWMGGDKLWVEYTVKTPNMTATMKSSPYMANQPNANGDAISRECLEKLCEDLNAGRVQGWEHLNTDPIRGGNP